MTNKSNALPTMQMDRGVVMHDGIVNKAVCNAANMNSIKTRIDYLYMASGHK